MCENRWKNKAKLLYRWIRLGQEGITIESMLMDRQFKKIAIYGFNEICKCLIYELDNSKVTIDCLIDERGDSLPINFKSIKPEKVSTIDVDAIIITFSEPNIVKNRLIKMANCKVISFEELVYEL